MILAASVRLLITNMEMWEMDVDHEKPGYICRAYKNFEVQIGTA